ncbi:MAG TPA: hypothetical protein DCZ48_06370 [Methylococcaceae bacterium]|nr:hypothetical protein [Methylococcaceae bacterium]
MNLKSYVLLVPIALETVKVLANTSKNNLFTMKNMKTMKEKAYKINDLFLHVTSCSSWLIDNIEYFHSLSSLGRSEKKA